MNSFFTFSVVLCLIMRSSVGQSSLAVMTMNQYLGADLFRLIRPDIGCFLKFWFNIRKNSMCITGKIVDTIIRSDVEGRVKMQANIIIDAMPDVVGLQETLLLNLTDAITGEVELHFDYLDILMSELDTLGGDYKIAGIHDASESTGSKFKDPLDETKGEQNVFATTRDVLLVRGHETQVENVLSYDYKRQARGKRGFVSADVKVRSQWYKVVNTHLETADAIHAQRAQIAELMNVVATEDDTILLGDFNSQPREKSYEAIIDSFFVDMWLEKQNEDAGIGGFTALQSEYLDNPVSELSERIDLIFYRGKKRVESFMHVYGDSNAHKTSGGLWPSDHAFVYANLSFAQL